LSIDKRQTIPNKCLTNQKPILAIYGSPRKGGRCDKALDIVIEGKRVDRLYIRGLKIKPCCGCLECRKGGICKIKDDMKGIIPRLISSDIIILSSPVYFKGLPSHLKAMIDRCQVLWERKVTKEKGASGFFILTCEKKGDFPGCIDVIKAFFATIKARLVDGIILGDNEPLENIGKSQFIRRVWQNL